MRTSKRGQTLFIRQEPVVLGVELSTTCVYWTVFPGIVESNGVWLLIHTWSNQNVAWESIDTKSHHIHLVYSYLSPYVGRFWEVYGGWGRFSEYPKNFEVDKTFVDSLIKSPVIVQKSQNHSNSAHTPDFSLNSLNMRRQTWANTQFVKILLDWFFFQFIRISFDDLIPI